MRRWAGAAAGLLLIASMAPASARDRSASTLVQGRAPTTLQAEDAQSRPMILDARIGEHSGKTRFVVETSDPIPVTVFTLADPDRVVIDLPQVMWRLKDAQRPSGNGAIKSYRYGLFRPGDSRLVIDLARPVIASAPRLRPWKP